MSGRRVGVNLPLFSARSSTGWGIGELTDIVPLSGWLGQAGFSELMLLPLGTMADGQTSPYFSISTLAIDPIFIALDSVSDFERAGGIASLSDQARAALDIARASAVVRYDDVRRAKHEAIGRAFNVFATEEWAQLTTRASSLAGYMARERWWLDDYALFQALSRSMPGSSWREWPAPLRDRDSRALDDARRQFAKDVLREQYAQWVAELQWQAARAGARHHGVSIVGDLPFVPNRESSEVWARAEEFLIDVSVGVPPDAFSATGQDWGLPTYRWDVIRSSDYAWIRQRARRMRALYDGLRVDHAVGLYRTYGRPPNGEPFFSPPDEPAQRAQGEAVFQALLQGGLELIAEDLGSVPDFVRASLAAVDVPGCKVLRWERDWHAPGVPFLDPDTYAPISAAMTGTHDTEPLSVWWDELAPEDRRALVALPIFQERGLTDVASPWTDAMRDALIEAAYRSGSRQLFFPMQDLFSWRDRVNVPGTVRPENWTWALPWPVDRLDTLEPAVGRAAALRALAVGTGRRVHDYTRIPPSETRSAEFR